MKLQATMKRHPWGCGYDQRQHYSQLVWEICSAVVKWETCSWFAFFFPYLSYFHEPPIFVWWNGGRASRCNIVCTVVDIIYMKRCPGEFIKAADDNNWHGSQHSTTRRRSICCWRPKSHEVIDDGRRCSIDADKFLTGPSRSSPAASAVERASDGDTGWSSTRRSWRRHGQTPWRVPIVRNKLDTRARPSAARLKPRSHRTELVNYSGHVYENLFSPWNTAATINKHKQKIPETVYNMQWQCDTNAYGIIEYVV